jgi:signal transduction histidine kinase
VTNDVLDLSKIEAGYIELESVPVDVTELVASLVRGNRVWAAEKGVTVQARIDPHITQCRRNWIFADPTRLNQLLLNLLSNGASQHRAQRRKEGESCARCSLRCAPVALVRALLF